MSLVLGLTILAIMLAVILILSGWSQITRNASFDDVGAGPIKHRDPFEFPERPHYAGNAESIRIYRKKRTKSGRKASWVGVVRPKLEPLARGIRDEHGQPFVLPEVADHAEFEQVLTQLEQRAGLPPLDHLRKYPPTQTES